MLVNNTHFTILTADRVIDAKGDAPIENGAILLQGDTIAAVGRAADIRAPEGAAAQTIDYAGCTIMPGMVDCHTHHNGFGDGRLGDDLALLPDEILTVQSARNARASLYSGVTTIRENGPKNMTMFRLRDAVNAGLAIGPRMVLCGRPVSIIGGHMGYFGGEVTGANDARALTPSAHQGGRGLHQDCRHRRDYAHIVPHAAVLRCGRTQGGNRRGAQVRQAHRHALLELGGHSELPRRRRGHDYPLLLPRRRRHGQLPRGHRRAHRAAIRIRQPDAASQPRHRLGPYAQARRQRA